MSFSTIFPERSADRTPVDHHPGRRRGQHRRADRHRFLDPVDPAPWKYPDVGVPLPGYALTFSLSTCPRENPQGMFQRHVFCCPRTAQIPPRSCHSGFPARKNPKFFAATTSFSAFPWKPIYFFSPVRYNRGMLNTGIRQNSRFPSPFCRRTPTRRYPAPSRDHSARRRLRNRG